MIHVTKVSISTLFLQFCSLKYNTYKAFLKKWHGFTIAQLFLKPDSRSFCKKTPVKQTEKLNPSAQAYSYMNLPAELYSKTLAQKRNKT